MNKEKQVRRGTFIVIEGTDGSGKGTQFKKLVDRFKAEKYDVEAFDFPQYDKPSSFFVQEYLNGRYGESDDVGPYTSSLFFALDRFHAAPQIRKALDEGKVVIANRFTGSNMAHQGTKFANPEERRGYFVWLDNLEFQMLKIPRPDRSIVLRVPADIAQQLVDKKEPRQYTNLKRDILEADLEHLKLSVDVYDELCNLFPKDFLRIDSARGNKMLSVDTIHELLYNTVKPLLPPKKKIKKMATQVTAQSSVAANPYVIKENGIYKVTKAGEDFLENCLTSVSDNIYAFNDKLSPVTIAAAMARLSRRGDDMRITILDEFANAIGKDEKLLNRVITAYGDDSVQQLAGQHVVVEKASNLLTKKLEWGRLAAYLEQSTRYIYFDKKDESGKYKYFVPETLDDSTRNTYIKVMDQIFDLYSEMVHASTKYVRDNSDTSETDRDIAWQGATRAQACDAIRPVLPVATTSTVGIYASGQALESLIMHLLSDELDEARKTGEKLLKHCRKTMPIFLERADKPDRGGAMIAYMANTRKSVEKLASSLLPEAHSAETEAVSLVSYWPKNELDLLPDMLYPFSNLPLSKLRDEVDQWPIEQKQTVFKQYMGERLNRRHKPGRALEQAHYSWDLVCDYGIFRDLQRHRMVDDLQWQTLTPRYGYDIPKIVEDANLTEQFEACFELSLKLYSTLQAAGYNLEAQYATLLGHKMRWKVTYNAREAFHFHELRTSPQGHPGYRKLVLDMHEKLAEAHPLLAGAMRFVNQDEDPALSRLAAERYTQFKLKNLN